MSVLISSAVIKDMGYDPVLHERGSVPYGSKDKLEEYCYREIRQVELVVSIIGSRFGSQSEHQPYSISQQELKTAYDLGVQVFIFVEAAVLGEYQTYLKNKNVAELKFSYVDDVRIYQFLEEIHGLPNNNQITPFASVQDIISFLREQWAGMFQRFLQNQERQLEVQIVKDLQANMQTLNQLVTYLTEEKQKLRRGQFGRFSDLTIQPSRNCGKLLTVSYRVFFTTRTEFSQWLKAARQYEPVGRDRWDDPEYEEWIKEEKDKPFKLLKISTSVFNEKGDLVIYTAQQWRSEVDLPWATISRIQTPLKTMPTRPTSQTTTSPSELICSRPDKPPLASVKSLCDSRALSFPRDHSPHIPTHHQAWADATLLTAVQTHPDSLHDEQMLKTLHHIVMVQRAFLHRFLDRPFDKEKESQRPEDFNQLVQHYRAAHEEQLAFISDQTERDLERRFDLPFLKSQPTVAEGLTQIIMHSQNHRGQCLTRLRENGAKRPPLDLHPLGQRPPRARMALYTIRRIEDPERGSHQLICSLRLRKLPVNIDAFERPAVLARNGTRSGTQIVSVCASRVRQRWIAWHRRVSFCVCRESTPESSSSPSKRR